MNSKCFSVILKIYKEVSHLPSAQLSFAQKIAAKHDSYSTYSTVTTKQSLLSITWICPQIGDINVRFIRIVWIDLDLGLKELWNVEENGDGDDWQDVLHQGPSTSIRLGGGLKQDK